MSDDSRGTNSNDKSQYVEIDTKHLLMPLAVIISAIIISVPISLSIYFGLRDNGLGGNPAGVALAAECDESAPFTNGCLIKQAQEIGIEPTKFKQCLDTKPYDSVISEELKYGEEIGIQGTPSIYIGENKGDKMQGFSVGAGVTQAELTELIDSVEKDGINKTADKWKSKQTSGLSAYETQLKDYYAQQGQTGDALKKTVADGMATRKTQIEKDIKVVELTVGQGMTKGNTNAKVMIMEFSDFECPYCQQFAKGIGKTIDDQFVSTGKIAFVYKDFPLESIHPSARKLANAVRCAGDQGKYFEMHDKVFKVTE